MIQAKDLSIAIKLSKRRRRRRRREEKTENDGKIKTIAFDGYGKI